MKKLILFSMFLAAAANAQPANIRYPLVSGVYTIRIQSPPDADLNRVCVERADLTPAVELVCATATPSQIMTVQVPISVTPNDDAELRAFAYDNDGFKSLQSPNAGIIDFTAPGAPSFVPLVP